MASPKEIVYDFLKGKGLPPNAIYGIMGNLMLESGFNTSATNPKSGAYGLAQWLGNRHQELNNYAFAHNEQPDNINAQLGFLWHELTSGYSSTLSQLQGATSPADAARIFEAGYEISGGQAEGARIAYAEQFAGGGGPDGSTASTDSTTSSRMTEDDYSSVDSLGNLLSTIPALKKLVDQAVAGNWSTSKFQNEVENSAWYKDNSDTARSVLIQQANDPAAYRQRLIQTEQSLINLRGSSGSVPVLSGGSPVAILPPGETVTSVGTAEGSFLALGTTLGLRIGTFDTYTGALSLGPISVNSTAPVYGMTSRDRYIYAGWTNQQPDGKTGLVRLDLSTPVDAAGRLAYCADLRPPASAPTGVGTVKALGLLPVRNKLIFVADDGLHVESIVSNSEDPAWLQTSRIRYDTAEMKLFKLGRIHGNLNDASIQVTGITPYAPDQNLGTFGFIVDQDPSEFALPPGLWEWIQLKFELQGSDCILNSYQVKAFPAPQVQDVIMFTVNCFREETDKYGLDVTDPQLPRRRWQNVVDLKNAGNEIRYVEFSNQGPVAELVLIDQIEFRSYSRPTVDDDFGGYITFKLRKTTT